jgi:hypothetical protein
VRTPHVLVKNERERWGKRRREKTIDALLPK